MTVVDLHPEELLDKDARGELSADERARLDTHLSRCSACRAERVMRMDFASELAAGELGPHEDRPSALLDLVQGALAAPRPLAATTSSSADTRTDTRPAQSPKAMPELDAVAGLRRRPRRTAVVLLVAAAVLAASAAGATGMTSRVWSRLSGGSLETTHASAKSPPAPALVPVGAGAHEPAVAATAPETPSAEAPAVESPSAEPETALSAQPALSPPPVVLVPAHAFVPTDARALTPAPAVEREVAPSAAPVPTTASGLFESANAARRSGDTVTALARYDALEAQFPATREARVAKATTGRLLLDRGDAVGALARFDAYLASGSSELREEAMAGRATALERLGRGDDESRAWAALLATYPGTPYGSHARSRIAASPVRSLPR